MKWQGRVVIDALAFQYLAKSANAIKQYIPPDPARIQASKDAGKATIEILDPGKRARLDFGDYRVPGDKLSIELDLVSNRLLGIDVITIPEGEKDPVSLDVAFGSLDDGTGYPKTTVLTAEKVGVVVKTENSGYKKAAP